MYFNLLILREGYCPSGPNLIIWSLTKRTFSGWSQKDAAEGEVKEIPLVRGTQCVFACFEV